MTKGEVTIEGSSIDLCDNGRGHNRGDSIDLCHKGRGHNRGEFYRSM